MPTESRLRVAQALHGVFGERSRVPDDWDSGLRTEDAGFANALLGLCLRHWGRLQTHIQPKLKDPGRGLPLGSQVVLAMGFAQLAWLPGTSEHAAVNEAVDLSRERNWGFPPHQGLVNALLRAGAKDRERLRQELDGLPHELDRTPFTERVLREALKPFNQEDRMDELWARLQIPPKPAFKAVKLGNLPPGLEPDPECPGGLVLSPGAPFPREWLASGAGMVQDRSSQAMMAFQWDRPVNHILDVCAAPGGKTTALALRWPKARIVALEQHPRRAQRLRENLQSRGVEALVYVEEAGAWLNKEGGPGFDLILLDAPCSGSGTLRKHPELTWLGGHLDLDRLIRTQRELLRAAIPRLTPGGLLVYSVCSWLEAEGFAHLTEFPALQPVGIWPTGLARFQPDPLAWEGEGFQAFALSPCP